jgi:F-type H+-transporting ATPase subunit delta
MISSAVVNRYANALVDVVVSPSSGIDPALAVNQLRSFEEALETAPDLRTVLASPAVSTARKRQVIRRIADAIGLERIIRNFLLVLSDHHRAAALAEMIRAFEVLVDERLGFLHAEVASASELSPQQRDQLQAELGKIAASQVRMKFIVDPDLIGGVKARIGSKVYDGSVRGQLAILRRRLALNQ